MIRKLLSMPTRDLAPWTSNTRAGRDRPRSLKPRTVAAMLPIVSVLLAAPGKILPGTGPTPAMAATITLTASRDNTMYMDSGDLSNGAGEMLFAGNNNLANARRLLVAFDLSGIPSGSTINAATLQLDLAKTGDFAARIHSLHTLLADWGEGDSNAAGGTGPGEGDGAPASPGDATWSFRFYDTDSWDTMGGDFDPAASATASVPNILATYEWGSNAAMVADVQQWLDDPPTNFGWILLGDESLARTAHAFYSREHSVEAQRPRLVIDYTPPVAASANSMGKLKSVFNEAGETPRR